MGNNITAMYEMTKSNIEKTIADQKARGIDSSVSEKCLEELKANYAAYRINNGEMFIDAINKIVKQENVLLDIDFNIDHSNEAILHVYGNLEVEEILPFDLNNSEMLEFIRDAVRRAYL